IHQEADSFRDAQNVSIPLGDLQILVKYGRDYLNEQDFEWALKEHWNRYYRKVGQMVIRNKSRDFWTYHKSALKRLGFSLDTCRVAGAAIQEILELILDPIGTFKRLRKKIATSR